MPSPEMPNAELSVSFEEAERERRKTRIIELSRELSASLEYLPFPGINPDSYAKLKAEEEEFSGFVTPVDELLERFKNEGMKVMFGRDPESGNVFVVPAGSDDVQNDSLFPRHLQASEDMDEKLKELISLSKE